MIVKFGLLAQLEAKPGRGNDLGAFLEASRTLAAAEKGTVTWYAYKTGDTSYGIFDAFGTEQARDAHLHGKIPEALEKAGPDLLARDPELRLIDIIAMK